MNIIIRMKLVGLFSLLALTGCASAPPRAPIAIDLGADKTFTFKSVNAEGGKITSSNITSAIGSALAKASGFPPVRDVGTVSMPSLSGRTDRKTLFEGLRVTQIPNAFKVAYIKGERHLGGYSTPYGIAEDITIQHVTSATFGYSIEEGEKIITVKITPPKQLEVDPAQHMQLVSDEMMSTDIKRIFNNMKP